MAEPFVAGTGALGEVNRTRRTPDLLPRTLAAKGIKFITFALTRNNINSKQTELPSVSEISGITRDQQYREAPLSNTNVPNGRYVYYLTLPVNPQEYAENWPTRTNVTQTWGGAFVDFFGLGIGTIVMRGTTGYRRRKFKGIQGGSTVTVETDGYVAIKNFRDMLFRTYFLDYDPQTFKTVDPRENKKPRYENFGRNPEWELYLFNWPNEDYYEVMPTTFAVTQSVNEALLYRYAMDLVVLRRIDKDAYYPKSDWLATTLNDAETRLKLFEERLIDRYWYNFILNEWMGSSWRLFSDDPAELAEGKAQIAADMVDDDTARVANGYPTMQPEKYFKLIEQVMVDYKFEIELVPSAGSSAYEISSQATVKFAKVKEKQTPLSGLKRINQQVADLVKDISDARAKGENKLLTPIRSVKDTLFDIYTIEQTVLKLPREIFPYQFVKELRETYCLFQSILAFPQLFKEAALDAYENFLRMLKASGCATTLRTGR